MMNDHKHRRRFVDWRYHTLYEILVMSVSE
jgi:hypothetical protein